MADVKKILLIDDEKDLCVLIKVNLEKTGEYEVTCAHNGADGLEEAKKTKFDLVITDFSMPGMPGGEVVTKLKEIDPPVPIILFSVYHDDVTKVTKEIKEKVDALVAKPLSDAGLREVIEKTLKNK